MIQEIANIIQSFKKKNTKSVYVSSAPKPEKKSITFHEKNLLSMLIFDLEMENHCGFGFLHLIEFLLKDERCKQNCQ